MASGLPVIAPDFAIEVADIILDSKCGLLIDSSNYLELKNALQSFIIKPCKINEMGENGIRAVKKKYNWDIEGNRLVKMYKEFN